MSSGYSASELGLLLGISSEIIRDWVQYGRVRYKTENKTPRITIADLAIFLANNQHYTTRLHVKEGYPYVDDFREDLIKRIDEINSRN